MTPTPEMVAMAERIANSKHDIFGNADWWRSRDAALAAIMEVREKVALVAPENVRRSVMASAKLGEWLAAALEDSNVCDDMKAGIREWFSAGDAVQFIGQYHDAIRNGEHLR